MLSSVENAINKMWKTRVSRSFFYRMCSYWVFITLGPLALSVLVGIGISSSVPLEKFLPTGSVLFLIGIALFFFIYKWVPQAKVNSACALISAAITASFWNLARWGYTYYTREIVAYNTVYGSLGAVPILLLWIYIAWVIVLAGVALTVALQRHWTRANREEKACVPTRL
jgi:membrane protein